MNLETIALIVTVVIFLLSTIINNFYIIDDRKKRWYVEIIINSNLTKTELFFKEILDLFKKHKNYLSSSFVVSNQEYLLKKAQRTKELLDLQNKFSFEIIPVFKSYDKNISDELLKKLEEFSDYYTENIGIETSKPNKDITIELEELKGSFYESLYSPVKSTFFKKITTEGALLWLLLVAFIFLFIVK